MPKVSIIIPVYNKGQYISSTLDSVLQQKYQDYEVIIVNDGSKDDSLEIINDYAAKFEHIRIINIPNGGVSNARNTGIRYANGEWIQFLDGDDKIDSEYLLKGMKLVENREVDILFTNFQMVDENGGIRKTVNSLRTGMYDQNGLCKAFIEQQYKNGFFGYISNKLIRRSLIEKANANFPTSINLAEDLDFYVLLYPNVEKAYFENIISFYYLQTDDNYLNRDKVDYFSQLMIHLDIRKWFIQSRKYIEYQEILDRKVSEYVFFVLFHGKENGQNIKKLYEKIVENDDIMASLRPELFRNYEKALLQAVKWKSCFAVEVLLSGRRMIRTIYRRIKNG